MEKINLDLITNPWQMAVAIVIVLAVIVWPGVLSVLQNKRIERQFINNGGSTMKDQLDRIEKNLGHIDKRVKALEGPSTHVAQVEQPKPAAKRLPRLGRKPQG